ncbi:MAG: alpha/beta hydrolase [Anaerolineaceae bacterium]
MPILSKAQEVEQRFHQLAQSGSYAEALDLATRESHRFPEHAQKVVYAWRFTMACRLKNKNQALKILKEAIDAGHWYGDLETDPDYDLLKGDVEFEKIVNICTERRVRAIADSVPVMMVKRPDSKNATYPLLIALHGSNGNIELNPWESAVSEGWLVALPQSSQIFAPGTFTWNDWDWAQHEVSERFSTLCSEYPIDSKQIVLTGFSLGAGLAAWLIFSGKIMARGLILVNPFLQDPTEIIPFLENINLGGLNVYLVAGQRDQYCLGVAQQLNTILPKYGINCLLDVYSDLNHSFPADFEQKLPQALKFVTMTEDR